MLSSNMCSKRHDFIVQYMYRYMLSLTQGDGSVTVKELFIGHLKKSVYSA